MANDEHLEILEKGVDAWNAWRDENLEVKLDLSEADLRGDYLSYILVADLSGADLSEAKLKGTKIDGATKLDNK